MLSRNVRCHVYKTLEPTKRSTPVSNGATSGCHSATYGDQTAAHMRATPAHLARLNRRPWTQHGGSGAGHLTCESATGCRRRTGRVPHGRRQALHILRSRRSAPAPPPPARPTAGVRRTSEALASRSRPLSGHPRAGPVWLDKAPPAALSGQRAPQDCLVLRRLNLAPGTAAIRFM